MNSTQNLTGMLCFNLPGPLGAQACGHALLLGVSVVVFLDEIHILVNGPE